MISTEIEKRNLKKEEDLAENDVEGGWGADVTVQDLEEALCEVVSAAARRGRRRSGLGGGTLFLWNRHWRLVWTFARARVLRLFSSYGRYFGSKGVTVVVYGGGTVMYGGRWKCWRRAARAGMRKWKMMRKEEARVKFVKCLG
jgi:hypothetical protein